MLNAIQNPYVVMTAIAVLVLLVGFVGVFRRAWGLRYKRDAIDDFRNEFITWCNSGFEDQRAYTALMLGSAKVQDLLGGWGTIGYRPPFSSVMFNNWDVITNAIPLILQFNTTGLSRQQVDTHAQLVDDTLLRGIGAVETELTAAAGDMKNPLKWASVGMTYILTLPVLLLTQFGILSKKTYDWISASLVIRSIAFLAWSLGFLSAVMSILMGWGDFLKMVKPLLHLS